MPPGRVSKLDGVVVRHSGECKAVTRKLIPLLAGDFACFTANAQGGVGEETSLRHNSNRKCHNIPTFFNCHFRHEANALPTARIHCNLANSVCRRVRDLFRPLSLSTEDFGEPHTISTTSDIFAWH